MMMWGTLSDKPVTPVNCQLKRRQHHEVHT